MRLVIIKNESVYKYVRSDKDELVWQLSDYQIRKLEEFLETLKEN